MTTVSEEITRSEAPKKGRVAVHIICWLLGNGCLFTWNSMLTVMDYYILIFPYHPARVLTLVYQPFALITICLFTYYEAKVNTRVRILVGFTLFFVSALTIPFIDIGTSGDGKLLPFIGLSLLSGITGIADALVQGGMVGDLSFMQTDFMQSYAAGGAASGVITSGLRMITKASFKESRNGLRKGAITFFFLSALFMLLCLGLYAFVFPRLALVKYYRAKAASEGSKTVNADLVAGGIAVDANNTTQDREVGKAQTRLTNKELLIQTKDYAIDCVLIYILTLSIFPGFLAEDTGKHQLASWYVVTLIAMYNCGDLVGRYIPLIDKLLIKSRTGLMLTCISRYVLIPAFYFTAKYGDQGWMLLLCIVLGISNGYLTVCVLMNAPKGFKGPEQNAIGNMMVLFILGGIFVGVLTDWLWLIGKGW
ncbi:hypothetical protein O6H91_15G016400 [Diphasiastrum complanatum]|uniref:Uncharacterized protein n=1 Tax=Diphasiastrum complanatum TaxID=34168 RepID=A0ACC2BG11_DIPCM|nr:hypothetical protein O6H91_15G016400 [Diphasiastrum complanatum]